MTGCLLSGVVWLAATVALFQLGSGSPLLGVVGGAALGITFVVQCVVWFTTKARYRRLVSQHVRLYGPVPDATAAKGTRVGGTIGRLVGGSTGYWVGGLAGAAADIRAEARRYEEMPEGQRELLAEVRRAASLNPLLGTLMMIGALLVSWLLLVFYEMARVILTA